MKARNHASFEFFRGVADESSSYLTPASKGLRPKGVQGTNRCTRFCILPQSDAERRYRTPYLLGRTNVKMATPLMTREVFSTRKSCTGYCDSASGRFSLIDCSPNDLDLVSEYSEASDHTMFSR